MNLRSLRISTRLILGFGLAILVGASLLALSMFSQSISARAVNEASSGGMERVMLTSTLKVELLMSAISMRNMGLVSELNDAYKHQKQAETHRAKYLAGLDRLKQQLRATEDLELVAALQRIDKEMSVQFTEVVGLLAAFSTEQAAKLIAEQLDPMLVRAESDLVKLDQRVTASTSAEIEAAREQASRQVVLVSVAGLICVGALCLLAWRIARSVLLPLRSSCEVVEQIALANLDVHVDARGTDEVSQLLRGIEGMREALANMVRQMRGGSEMVAMASSEIASGNADLSRRAEQQASALQETSSTMHELDTTVRHTANNAALASERAQMARDLAQRGGVLVGEVVSTMRDINDSSRRIADITGVIDGIAFQTNILALNAAVEAARAGEQGRGFAVVACEVRSLAQRAASAAREIKQLIGSSVERVESGRDLVERAGTTMDEIVGAIRAVSDVADEIRTATSQQSEGVSQVGRSVTQLDQSTQQTAALVEQNAASAESLRQQAGKLVGSVEAFRLPA